MKTTTTTTEGAPVAQVYVAMTVVHGLACIGEAEYGVDALRAAVREARQCARAATGRQRIARRAWSCRVWLVDAEARWTVTKSHDLLVDGQAIAVERTCEVWL